MTEALVQKYRRYVQAHRTRGCRISHMLGVPITLLGVLTFFFKFRQGVALTAFGYLFQVVGHLVFEKNRPVLLTTGDLTIIPLAFMLVSRDWRRAHKRRFIYTGDFRKTLGQRLRHRALKM